MHRLDLLYLSVFLLHGRKREHSLVKKCIKIHSHKSPSFTRTHTSTWSPVWVCEVLYTPWKRSLTPLYNSIGLVWNLGANKFTFLKLFQVQFWPEKHGQQYLQNTFKTLSPKVLSIRQVNRARFNHQWMDWTTEHCVLVLKYYFILNKERYKSSDRRHVTVAETSKI